MIRAAQFQEDLQLECLVPSAAEEWDIHGADINRPGMQLCGYYEYFAYERPQVLGKVEMSYISEQPPEKRREILTRYFSYDIPCVVICRGMEPCGEFLEAASKRGIPVYRTPVVTSKFAVQILNYLNRVLAPHAFRHGVLLDVYGIGVMLSGKSGVGKSEAALELIKRGHQLVADDLVDICRVSENQLIGTSPERIRNLMEVRGIGIIDIRAMYGISAVAESKTIDMIMELVPWNGEKVYDRVGLVEENIEILGVPVIHQIMPVGPGRNLAIIIEVAARNFSLKRMGYHAAMKLNDSLKQDFASLKQDIARDEEY